jgi:orotate phosphoribosyltransferase
MARPPTPGELAAASIEELFARSGALREGHFTLKSGRHSGRYLEKFLVLQYPSMASEICRRMAAELSRYDPTLVVGPTTGGVLLAFEVARQLSALLGREVRGIFAEPVTAADGSPAGRALRRGWPVASAERIVVVDDILTTGASLLETIEAIRAAGPAPLAACVIADRSSETLEIGIPFHALGRIEISSWPASDCDLCRAGVLIEKPGSSPVPV